MLILKKADLSHSAHCYCFSGESERCCEVVSGEVKREFIYTWELITFEEVAQQSQFVKYYHYIRWYGYRKSTWCTDNR